jgi:hypothetical protein
MNNMYADCANGGNLPIIRCICPKQGKTNLGNKSRKQIWETNLGNKTEKIK